MRRTVTAWAFGPFCAVALAGCTQPTDTETTTYKPPADEQIVGDEEVVVEEPVVVDPLPDTDTTGQATTPDGTTTPDDATIVEPRPDVDTGDQPEGDVTDTAEANSKDEFVQDMQTQLDELNTQITQLEARGEELSEDAQAEWQQQLDKLKQEREEFSQQLADVQAAAQENWQDLQQNTLQAWAELQTAYDDAAARFEE